MITKTFQIQVQDDHLERIAQTRKPILGTASLLAAASSSSLRGAVDVACLVRKMYRFWTRQR